MAAKGSKLDQQFEILRISAALACQAGRFTVAEEQFRQLIPLQRRALGPEHEDTLDSQLSHAFSLSGLGRHVEAEAILREVLQVQQQSPSFGMEHERTLNSVMALGRNLVSQGRYKEAEPMLRKVHALDVRMLGPRHWETLEIQTALGNSLAGDNRLVEAEGLLRDALEAYQAMDHSNWETRVAVGAAMINLAKCIFKAAKYAEAEALLRAAVKYNRHNLGEEHTITINCMAEHALVLSALGRHAAAEVMYRLAAQGHRATLGWKHPATLSVTRMYANCLMAQKKLEPAEALLRDALSHMQQALGNEHPTVLDWMRDLAKLLQQQAHTSKRNDAKALLRRARELARNRQG